MDEPGDDGDTCAGSKDSPSDLIPLAWEVPDARALIPDDLKAVIDAPTRLLRVRFDVDAKQRRKHRDVADIYQNLSTYLEDWRYARHQGPAESRPDVGERWQIVSFVRQPTEPAPGPSLSWPASGTARSISRQLTGGQNDGCKHSWNVVM